MNENINQIPTISSYAPDLYRGKSQSHEEYVKRFIAGYLLQWFCNNPENGVHSSMLMQVCRCQENGYYILFVEDDTEENILDDFRINLRPNEGLRLYKVGRFINRPSCPSEIRTFYTATFWVTFEEGYWNAELILEDDGQLFPRKVQSAFRQIAEFKEFTLQGERPQMSSIRLAIQGTAAFETKAWAQKFTTPEGEEKTLLCLMDNGRIVEVSSAELPVCEPCNGAILRTKFNWFSWDGERFNRLKD